VVGEHLLRQRLVAPEDEAARVAAGIGDAEQLQVGDHVLVVDRVAVELLEKVEGDVRPDLLDGVANLRQVADHAERQHLVAELAERREDVVLGLPGDHHHVGAGGVGGRHQVAVHERQDAQPLHRTTRGRPLLT
jgi:hypothetical protein